MKVTKVTFEESDSIAKSLAVCSIVLDDCLKISEINLYRNEKGYYLVLPSRKTVYEEIEKTNPEVEFKYPKKQEESNSSKKKMYEEFFYPVESFLYKELLKAVVEGYSQYKHKGKWSYRP